MHLAFRLRRLLGLCCLVFFLASTISDLTSAEEEEDASLQFEIIKPAKNVANVAAAGAARSSSPPALCANVMPGLNRLRRGVDAAKLDLSSLAPMSGDDGFRKPIVDFTCAEGKKINVRIPGGQFRTYDLPDQAWDVAALPGGFLSERVEIFKSSRQVQKSMAANAGVDVFGGIFSASASYEKMSSSLTNESRYLETVDSVVSASRVDLAPHWGFSLSRYAEMFVDRRLPETFEADPARYAEFITHFGTHYFAYGKYGGVIKLLLETESSYFRGKTESKIKAQAGGMFKNILKAKGGYDGAAVTVDEEFRRKTRKTIRYLGGDANLLDAEGLREWQPTVAENPWLFGGQLMPLSDLLDEETAASKRKAMKRAVEVHLDKARLRAAERLVYAQMAAMRDDAAAVAKLRKYLADCDALSTLPSPESRKVDDLCDEIERELVIPDWFKDDVKICYRWYPDGDGGQCGGGVGRLLCANVDEFTQYYRDDTDRRGGGCRMSWGVQAPATAPDWFENSVRICYRWYPDGNAGQCGGGAGRNLCAKVGEYTAYYRDDTDRRGGGCRMSWGLMVGSSAPLWAKNLDLCYQWYPDGNGGQCGGGVGRNLCAKANGWTEYYRDDTDRRSGGCRMRWGIKTK